MTLNSNFVALLRNVLTDLTLVNVQKRLNSWLHDELNCKQSAFCFMEEDKCFVNVVGTDVLSSGIEMGKPQQWEQCFKEGSDIDFENMPQYLQHYVRAIFKLESKSFRVTLHIVRSDQNGCLKGMLFILYSPSTESHTSEPEPLRVHIDIASALIGLSLDVKRRLNQVHLAKSILKMFTATFENPDSKFHVAETVCETIKEFVSCEDCRLYWVDNERNEFIFFKKNTDFFQSVIQQERFPVYEGMLSKVLSNLQIGNVTTRRSTGGNDFMTAVGARRNDQNDDVFFHSVAVGSETAKITDSENRLWLPILKGAQIMAILQITKSRKVNSFSDTGRSVVKQLQPFLASCLLQMQWLNHLHEKNCVTFSSERRFSLSGLRIAEEEVLSLSLWEIQKPEAFCPYFTMVKYTAQNLSAHEILKACLIIFADVGFISSLKIERTTLARFLLALQKSHRNLPYHNWNHAFITAHFCFILMKRIPQLCQLFSDIELISIFIACICHGIDYHGNSDQLQLVGEIPLSDNDLNFKCHNFDHISCILNFGETNILSKMPLNCVETSLSIIKEALQANRLSNYFRIRSELLNLCETGIDPSNGDHHLLLRSLLMIACYMSHHVMAWDISKKCAFHFFEELFAFGDLEKVKDRKPRAVMERGKADIVKLQIQYLDVVVLPIFKILGILFPNVINFYESASYNLLCYETMKQLIYDGKFSAFKGEITAFIDCELEKAVRSEISKKCNNQSVQPKTKENR
ncbi:PDEase I domain containing protein [Trichuris trichiura]|uniref:PDEase I domain containing protein n=1 Tax=Trichuris trichiura TaxID=36087 RepID=A0A077ZPB3_TRITR|nr:PDEase I domain containing protein [Trichuris trichiura]